MQSHIFYPKSIAFVKKKAKDFQRAFPGLALFSAQNATAVALGFQNWFDCNKRIAVNQSITSCHDEDIDHQDRLMRRHHQFCALVDIAGVAPHDAADFVRHWGLTSKSIPELEDLFCTGYEELMDVYSGVSKRASVNLKADEIDDPHLLGEGIILGGFPFLKYDYYALDIKRLSVIPFGVRGNTSMFLEYESGRLLSSYFKEVIRPGETLEKDLEYISENYPYQYEWITGVPGRGLHKSPTIKMLINDAIDHPDSWYALSLRSDLDGRHASRDDVYVPAIKGREFVQFLQSQGYLKFRDVSWFKLINTKSSHPIFEFCWGMLKQSDLTSALRLETNQLEPCLPLYHSPFKHGPMEEIEYSVTMEGGGLMLADELDVDD